MAKAKAAGQFLGGIFNNPGVIILGGLAIALLFFQKDIRNAFGSLGAGLGDITLPAITLPEIKFPEFKFPDFKFPDITFPTIPNPFAPSPIPKPQKMVEDTGLAPLETCQCGASIVQDAFGNVNVTCKQCVTSIPPGQGGGLTPIDREPSDAELFAKDFPETFVPTPTLTPAQEFVSNLPGGFQAFVTPGSSFVGASINPTPIENLSLSQIIDMFNVTASQAANIKAIAQDDFGDFDFGTNTGGGIGSVIPSISSLIGGSDLNVSNNQFQGLSAQQIANILTGGNIQNF